MPAIQVNLHREKKNTDSYYQFQELHRIYNEVFVHWCTCLRKSKTMREENILLMLSALLYDSDQNHSDGSCCRRVIMPCVVRAPLFLTHSGSCRCCLPLLVLLLLLMLRLLAFAVRLFLIGERIAWSFSETYRDAWYEELKKERCSGQPTVILLRVYKFRGMP